jgi:hypothetical protein
MKTMLVPILPIKTLPGLTFSGQRISSLNKLMMRQKINHELGENYSAFHTDGDKYGSKNVRYSYG